MDAGPGERRGQNLDPGVVAEIEDEVLSAMLREHGPIRENEDEAGEVVEELRGLARVAAIVIAAYGSEEWFVKYGGALVAFPDVDPVWTVRIDGAVLPSSGPTYVVLSRGLYAEGREYVPFDVPGLEQVSPAELDEDSWGEFSSRYPEAARHLETALRLAWAATHRFNLPVLVVRGWRPPLAYRVLLPIEDFRDEDVLKSLEAMEWMLEQLRRTGFPLMK